MRKSILLILILTFYIGTLAQVPPVVRASNKNIRSSKLTRKYLTPVRVVKVFDEGDSQVNNAGSILKPGVGQADLNQGEYLSMVSTENSYPGIILDFGCEIHGGLEMITTISNTKPAGKVRIRFGESVAETMSNTSENSATNDHAMRDFILELPWLGSIKIGESGFRFVRIDLVDPNTRIEFREINAEFVYRDIPYLGFFECNDARLNDIWMTGAYTVHLNMQNYLWDGIKRDRLVWVGDLHPEVMTVNTVFGQNEVVPKSLDLARDLTPLPAWMNGISSYSMWWVLIHRDWYQYHGDMEYLKEQREYLTGLLKHLSSKIDENGQEMLDGNRFLDWPTSEDPQAVHEGLQAMMLMTFDAGAELCEILDESETVTLCRESAEKLKMHVPELGGSKQGAALMAMAGLVDPKKVNDEVLAIDGAHNMSTFYGYYMLEGRALAGDFQGAINNIRTYWGGMLDLGATTFWEHFDIDWMVNAGRIDEVVRNDKVDVHGKYGDYCYVGYRHSLCHGWASGPTPWLTKHVLGVKVVEPGGKTLKIEPHLGDLEWVKGTFPTSYGIVQIEHKKNKNGKIETICKSPENVTIIK